MTDDLFDNLEVIDYSFEDEDVGPKRSLDIFEVLKAADKKDFDFYSRCNEQQQKELAPIVLMRWLSTNYSDRHEAMVAPILINQFVNREFWSLQKHKELQWKLLCCITSGRVQRHGFIKVKSKRKLTKFEKILLSVDPSLGNDELKIVKSRMTTDKYEQLLKDLGMPDSDIKDYLKEYNNAVK